MEDRYNLIIRRNQWDKPKGGDIMLEAYDISLVCAYNLIKLYGNNVELRRLEGDNGKEIQP